MYEQGMVRMQAEGAKEASVTLGLLCADVKNKILLAMAEGLMQKKGQSLLPMPLIWKMDVKAGLRIPSWIGCCSRMSGWPRWPKAFGRLQTLRTPWEKS